jgi:hypothetical protein
LIAILAKSGHSGQLTDERKPADAPADLFEPVPGPYGAHERIDSRAREGSWQMFTDHHHTAAGTTLAMVAGVTLHQIGRRLDI